LGVGEKSSTVRRQRRGPWLQNSLRACRQPRRTSSPHRAGFRRFRRPLAAPYINRPVSPLAQPCCTASGLGACSPCGLQGIGPKPSMYCRFALDPLKARINVQRRATPRRRAPEPVGGNPTSLPSRIGRPEDRRLRTDSTQILHPHPLRHPARPNLKAMTSETLRGVDLVITSYGRPCCSINWPCRAPVAVVVHPTRRRIKILSAKHTAAAAPKNSSP